ncbi:hypothetical protein RIE95_17015 [Acidithiobacillus thiooxidans]|nr:hypothetical protein [Acidithiobacillus thiooxidans]MDR7928664.1 hypothetical protein [Acidithiobacillus thiooxidans]
MDMKGFSPRNLKFKPMGIAEYKRVESLPENLKANLPSIERELQGEGQ